MRTICCCFLIFWLIEAYSNSVVCAQQRHASAAPGLERMPDGWELVREVSVPAPQLAQLSKKLNVPLESLFNTFVRYDGQELQINSLIAANAADAERLKQVLRKDKSNPRSVTRSMNRVYELVVQRPEQARLASRARSELAIMPATQTYAVQFSAIPIDSESAAAGPDGRNRLFNLLLKTPSDAALTKDIAALSRHFTFTTKIELARDLQGFVTEDWKCAQADLSPSAAEPELVGLQIVKPKQYLGLPMIDLQADITINFSKKRPADAKLVRQPYLMATPRFPADTPEIQAAVKSIIANANSDAQKVSQLLKWFADTKNMRYEGLVGSRYGTLTVLKQHFGRCWDYSDLFVTMARAAGLPCRQTYGWLYEIEGHVWCDVLIDGHWLMVDPTSACACDISYIPFCVSANGEFPLVYASQVHIQEK